MRLPQSLVPPLTGLDNSRRRGKREGEARHDRHGERDQEAVQKVCGAIAVDPGVDAQASGQAPENDQHDASRPVPAGERRCRHRGLPVTGVKVARLVAYHHGEQLF